MRKVVYANKYTCDVCGEEIPEGKERLEVIIPREFNLGEEGIVRGTAEWHFHGRCRMEVINHLKEKFSCDEHYTEGA